MEHRHTNLVASLEYAHITESIIYITMRLAKSTHQQVILQQSTQNPTSLEFHGSEKIPVIFLVILNRNGTFALAKNFAYLSSFAKVPVPV